MQRTVLELVQTVLTETGGDEVNSISDTIEAGDIATIMQQVYNEMVDEFNLPSTRTLQTLVGLGDPDLPNLMQIPDGSYDLQWIKYDTRIDISGNKNYQDITYLEPKDFVDMATKLPSNDTTNYKVITYSAGIPLIINKLRAPSYWTSFDDNYIVFDAYNSTTESTLQSSKSLFYSETRPTFFIEDDFVPDLPQNLENVLYAQTVNRVLATDQMVNPVTQRQESRFRTRTQRNKWKEGRKKYRDPDFGRK